LRALKYFNEKLNEYHIVAAGSLLGVALAGARSFPNSAGQAPCAMRSASLSSSFLRAPAPLREKLFFFFHLRKSALFCGSISIWISIFVLIANDAKGREGVRELIRMTGSLKKKKNPTGYPDRLRVWLRLRRPG
jgi:hypothetical protein